uniref:Uncharacterized protein n=1 Tax=Strombidium rassoulzadegani TaxID=1082188 RepID=A0A7S3CKH6_9SPIT|mmetsp:Transcript_11327/g.19080  ORF Transcript_11327/g.19080 Transcript_11327/m.19080 type:complete len:186 (+) Transcript_11327:456-1013(+)
MNIAQIETHKVVKKKDRSLEFRFTQYGQKFSFVNKDARKIDYELLDKVIHAITIDTEKFQGLYHNLIYKQVPSNLRPDFYMRHVPQYFARNLGSNQFLWRCLNRTIYRNESGWLRKETNKKEETSSLSQGRKRVLSLDQQYKSIDRQFQKNRKMNMFAEKFATKLGLTPKEFRQQGGMKGLHQMI